MVADRTTMESPITLEARDVRVTYKLLGEARPTLRKAVIGDAASRSLRTVQAVRGVDLVVREGEVVGVVGRNGSGKTSLLRALAGLLPVSGGVVCARSHPVLLGVHAAMRPELSARRNIVLAGLALGRSRARMEEHLPRIAAFAGVEEAIDRPLKSFSAGMSARVHFSVATDIDPDILAIDETLSVGDESFRRKSEARIRDLVGRASTVLIVSHVLEMIEELCSRVIWIDDGILRDDGVASDVINRYRAHMAVTRA